MLSTCFEHIKVLELASVLAGPLAGSFMSELGATVVKVENKLTDGDVTRNWKNLNEDPTDQLSSYYASANYNKEVILLDFNNKKERDHLEKLIAEADIIISNFQKRVAEKFELDPYQLQTKYPKKIIAQLDAYSYGDPRPAYDMVMQAEVGYISMCGEEGVPAKIPVAMVDILAGHQLKEAILLAMISKLSNDKGSLIFVSLYKSALTGLINQASNYLNDGFIPKPMGTKHPNIAPYGDILTTSDNKKVMLVIGSDQQFKSLLLAFNLSHLLEKFDTNRKRIDNRAELMKHLNSFSSHIGFEILTSLLNNKGLPYGVIKNLGESLNSVEAKQMIIAHSNGKRTIKGIAFNLK